MNYSNLESGYGVDIESATVENPYFRRVIYTTPQQQLVLMSILPGDDIPMEVHPHTSQFIRFEKGKGQVIINDVVRDVQDGSAVVIPAGTRHQVINTSMFEPLKLYTVYSPPIHGDQVIEPIKLENHHH